MSRLALTFFDGADSGGNLLEIIPGVHAVPGTHFSRIYLIEDDELTLVDTGMPWSAGRVVRYIRSIGRSPNELRRILMTHNHPDHTGGAPGIVRRSGAKVVAHQKDTLHQGDSDTLGYMGFFSSLSVSVPFLKRVTLDRALTEEQIIPVAGGIRVLHTPGHTPGSVCYMLEREGLLFSGDTIFSEHGRVSRSVPFPGSDSAQYQRSLERLASIDFDILCGGHGSPLVGDASKKFRGLLESKPELPTWREFFFRRLPHKMLRHMGFSAEDY